MDKLFKIEYWKNSYLICVRVKRIMTKYYGLYKIFLYVVKEIQ